MLTKEQLREARLKAFESKPENESPTNAVSSVSITPMNNTLAKQLHDVIHTNGGASVDDMERWYNQGFNFCEEPNFGLKQGHGGPCGILAAVQAELLKHMFFIKSQTQTQTISSSAIPNITNEDVESYFIMALRSILVKCMWRQN